VSSTPNLRRSPIRFRGLCAAAGAIACCATLAGFAAPFGWLFELTSHFRLQYAVVLAILAVTIAIHRAPWTASLFAVGAIVNLIVMAPYLWPHHRAPIPIHPETITRLLLVNVQAANTNRARVIEFVRDHRPDIAAFLEIDKDWLDALRALDADYPYSIVEPRDDNFGIALLSRIPLSHPNVVYLGDAEVPSIRTALALPRLRHAATSDPEATNVIVHHVTLLVTHPLPPGSPDYFRLRNQQLEAIADTLTEIEGPTILLGDLNVTPWSPHFRSLITRSGLHDTARGHRLRGTWPSRFPPLRIPLDHCLSSSEFRAVERTVGPDLGSDHLPLLVALQPTD
jgi:endonuclease/exonuclease/phosphatase (EEP) superfamily protein YafD